MILLKIVFQNLLKHRWLSLVLLIIFTSVAFIIYWIFGFSNYFGSYIYKSTRSWSGDAYASIAFTDTDKIASYVSNIKAKNIYFTRNIYVMVDSPKQSGMIWLNEFTSNIKDWRMDYYRPASGRLPVKPDEIMLSDYDFKKTLKVGDTLYLTTTTPERVINAIKYTVVGINKSGGNLITQEGMDQLLNSKSVNRVIGFIDKNMASKHDASKLGHDLYYYLYSRCYVQVNYTTDIYWLTGPYQTMIDVFTIVKTFLIVLLMPLIGIVIAVIVYMYAFKRRKEIWTYVALGMRDLRIHNLIVLEYIIASIFGTLIGIGLGFLTDFLSKTGNIYLDLGDLMYMPLRSEISLLDVMIIIVFILLTIYIASYKPIKTIMKQKPFSY